MNTPLFTAETSLYKTSRSYRGPGSRPAGDAGSTVVPQQGLCFELCNAGWQLCRGACGPSIPFIPDPCDLCDVAFGLCLESLPAPRRWWRWWWWWWWWCRVLSTGPEVLRELC